MRIKSLFILFLSSIFPLVAISCEKLEDFETDEYIDESDDDYDDDSVDDYIDEDSLEVGINNVLQNVSLITDCEYVTTNRLNALRTYERGTILQGIVYSSSRYEDLMCPNNVSYWTYLTAMSNPNSYQYTVDLSMPPYSLNGDAKTFYGQSCTSFVRYALGIKYSFQIHQMTVWKDFKKVKPNEVGSLKMADMLISENKTHTRLVTGIMYERGEVSSVIISEGIGPVARRRLLSASEIQEMLENDGYQIFRYRKLPKVQSSPFPYDIDINNLPIINPYIMPRRGDKANWRKDENVVIDILDCSAYSSFRVFKDGELYIESKLSNNQNELNLGILPPGDYSMLLFEGEVESPSVYWMVVDYHVDVETLSSGKVKVSYTSSNATPIFMTWRRPSSTSFYNNHMPQWTTVIDSVACEQGFVVSELDSYLKKKYGLGEWGFKVAFETKYGIISSDTETAYVK